jgi:hypothetical protein
MTGSGEARGTGGTHTTDGAGEEEARGGGISQDDRRYLRKRKMALDQALFNAAQPGAEEDEQS